MSGEGTGADAGILNFHSDIAQTQLIESIAEKMQNPEKSGFCVRGELCWLEDALRAALPRL